MSKESTTKKQKTEKNKRRVLYSAQEDIVLLFSIPKPSKP
jgi:hypothetical protein